MNASLEKKVKFAIHLLQAIPQDGDIELSYSGGKDSDVILELAKMAGIKYRAIYKNTTIDPPGTIAHAKEAGAEILPPKKTFFEIVREKGMPTRWRRFCCSILKEYKICDRAVQGIRRSESTKRAKLYKEPEICRLYPKGEKVRVYLPILEWTNDDVAEFIAERGIKCHPLYYDEQGNFHVERRLGCIGCPLAAQRNRREQFMQYPKMLRAIIKNYQYYLDNHKDRKLYQVTNGSAYTSMFMQLFCKNREDYESKITGGLFSEQAIDAKRFLEEYFGLDFTKSNE